MIGVRKLHPVVKIHYHSECEFFAGSENMLPNFFNAGELRTKYFMSFSYVGPPIYLDGLMKRLTRPIEIHHIRFIECPQFSFLPVCFPHFLRKALIIPIRVLFYFPSIAIKSFILYRVFKKIDPDILHINNGGYPGASSSLAAALAGRILGVRGIIMVVNNMAVGYKITSRWIEFPIDRLIRHCVTYFVTGSKAAALRLSEVLDLANKQLKIFPNGIALINSPNSIGYKSPNLDGFHGKIFGVVALLIPRKGHQILFNAVLNLVKEMNYSGGEFVILVEGSGCLKESLLEFVNNNKLSSWVQFVGDEPDIMQFMNGLDVLILPSIRDEDFPNVILEAMSLGKPVIASRLAGIPDQVADGITGILVEPGNAQQLSLALHDLISGHIDITLMGRAALIRFNQHFNLSKSLARYDSLYAELLGNG